MDVIFIAVMAVCFLVVLPFINWCESQINKNQHIT